MEKLEIHVCLLYSNKQNILKLKIKRIRRELRKDMILTIEVYPENIKTAIDVLATVEIFMDDNYIVVTVL